MRNQITDNGVNLLLEVLQQSRSLRTLMEEKNKINPNENVHRQKKNVSTYTNKSPAKVTFGPKTDGLIILSRKGYHQNKEKQNEYFKKIKNSLNDILSRMTEQDYMKISEAGFDVQDITIESLSFAIDLIKESVGNSQAGEKSSYGEKKSNLSEDEIKNRMEDENLPVTKESVEKVSSALELSEDIANIDRKDILYLLHNRLSPSIENIYKARYSKQNLDGSGKLSDQQWKELEPQVNELLNQMGLAISEENLVNARWLIENQLPLTKENLNQIIGLEKLSETYDKEVILDKIFSAMREGFSPEGALLIEEDSLNLDDNNNKSEEILRQISAKRQLEEVRLKMTSEAARYLKDKGLDIDTKDLEKIVEELRIEEEYYRQLYRQEEIVASEERLQLLRTTTDSIQQLKAMPINLIGATLNERGTNTITSLLESGNNIISELDKAKEAYETLYTQPRQEYGDSILKAFNNMGSLIEEMGIEDTEYNRRAIRILGYNQMDITKESIDKVKAYDLSVNYLIENLHPKIAVQIIKDGDSPLNIPIDDLNKRIETIKEKEDNLSLEKYSSYLYKLEKEDGISESERKAYIGLYRLLYQIDKSDGAALGALIKSESQVTLNHLLTAIRTRRVGHMDHKIDDNYGLLEDLSFDKESISEQLEAVFKSTGLADMEGEQSVRAEIQSSIIKELLNNISPDKLYQLHQTMVGEFPSADIWNTLGNIPIEQLLEQLKNTEEGQGKDRIYYHEKMMELRQIYSNSDQAIHFLNDFKMPCTTTNLMLASQIINNGGTVFKKFFGLVNEEKEESDKNLLKKKLELTDTLIDEETMNEAYEQLEDHLNAVISKEVSEADIDLIKINQLNSLSMQMGFMKNLARRNFYQIPLETSGKLTNINLTVIRGQATTGKVTVSFESEKLGSIKAEASLKDNKLSGYFSSDNIEGLKKLKVQEILLRDVLEEEKVSIKQLNFYLNQSSDGIYTYKNTFEASEEKDRSTEETLYKVAKAIISMIRIAEEVNDAA